MEINMPKFGQTMERGEIIEWYVKEGDKVSKGDTLCEISSEKITNDLEAFEDGVIEKILVNAGEEAEIGSPIAILKKI